MAAFQVTNFAYDGIFTVYTYTAVEHGGLGLPVCGPLSTIECLLTPILGRHDRTGLLVRSCPLYHHRTDPTAATTDSSRGTSTARSGIWSMDDCVPPPAPLAMGSTSREMDDVGCRSVVVDSQVFCRFCMAVSQA